MRLALLATAAIVLAAGPATSQSARAPFTVAETGRSYGSLQEAVGAIGGGTGTIRIAPGRYQDCAVQDAGRVTFVAERAGTAIFDHAICEGKATLVLRGRSAKVDGIVFTHVEVGDGNGSGIRIEKGDLNVVNAMFVDNQGGILSATDPSGSITIDRSTFSGLGKDPTGNGAHSIYIGEYGSLTVTRCRFERGRGGHYLKSRSPRITVLDSSFDDTHGHITNYMIDLSNGASGRIAGNEFVVGTDKENHSTLITVAPEGVRNDSSGLVVEGNRARLAPGAAWHPDFVGNWSSDKVVVRNNQLGPNIRALNSRWL